MTALLLLVPLAPLTVSLLIALWGKHSGWLNVLGVALSLLALLLIGGASPALSGLWFESGAFQLTAGLSLGRPFQTAGVSGGGRGPAGQRLRGGLHARREAAAAVLRHPLLLPRRDAHPGAADSFALLFAAWEGVGLASYLLIGFHYTEEKARKAALRAFLMTRVGDVGLLLGWLLALNLTGTSDIATLSGTSQHLARWNGGTAGPALFDRGHRQKRPTAADRLAAGRDGGADARFGAAALGDDGGGGRVSAAEAFSAVRRRARRLAGGGHRRAA